MADGTGFIIVINFTHNGTIPLCSHTKINWLPGIYKRVSGLLDRDIIFSSLEVYQYRRKFDKCYFFFFFLNDSALHKNVGENVIYIKI